MSRKQRTDIDWSKHVVEVTEVPGLLIHHIRIPDSFTNSVKFINTENVMAVTGDFGNWIFCREFHPSADGGVSDGYWIEKLRIASNQEGREYDPEGTEKALNAKIEEISTERKEENEDWDPEDDEEIEYLNDCLGKCYEEFEYKHFAYSNYPDGWDSEMVIFEEKTPHWLNAIFDAFDEMCFRLSENNK